jgi:hypothetical protein
MQKLTLTDLSNIKSWKTETIRIRIDTDLLNKVRTLAEQQTRPLAKQLEHLLKLALKTQGE